MNSMKTLEGERSSELVRSRNVSRTTRRASVVNGGWLKPVTWQPYNSKSTACAATWQRCKPTPNSTRCGWRCTGMESLRWTSCGRPETKKPNKMTFTFHETKPAVAGKKPEGWRTDRLPGDPALYLDVQNDEGEVVRLALQQGQALTLAAELQTRALVNV